ncbi:MAG: C13 family peptidase [bacterium]
MRKSITAIFLLCISLFLCAAAYAQTNDNVAVISFVGDDDEAIFKQELETIKKAFTSQDGAFRAAESNYFTIDMQASFPEGFTDKTSEAMKKIAGKNNAVLVIALSSHGHQGYLDRKNLASIKYEDLFNTLLKNAFEAKPEVQIAVFLDACYSGSAIEWLKVAGEGHKVSIYTSVDADHTGFGFFFSALRYVGSKDKYKSSDIGLTAEGYYVLRKLMDGTTKNALIGDWNSY